MAETRSSIDQFPGQKLSRSNGPLYRQLVDLLVGLITSGALPVGSDLPKEAELEARLGVSLITVRHGLRELVDLGLIEKRPAKLARVVSQQPKQHGGYQFKTFEDLTEFTQGARLVVESYGPLRSSALEQYFSLGEGEVGYCLKGHLAVGTVKQTVVTTYFPPDVGSQLEAKDFTDVLIFRNVERRLNIAIERVLVTARAELADASVARQLSIKRGAALMTTKMVYVIAGRADPVEVTITSTPAELFALSYDIELQQK